MGNSKEARYHEQRTVVRGTYHVVGNLTQTIIQLLFLANPTSVARG